MHAEPEENLSNKDSNFPKDMPPKLPSINIQENQSKPSQNQSDIDSELKLNKEKSISSLKLKITEHQEIHSKENHLELPVSSEEQNIDNDNLLFPNDFYSEESKKSEPKIIEGKQVISINDIIGEETEQILSLEMIDDSSVTIPHSKISIKRVSIVINLNKPKFCEYNEPWPKIAYFGVFDGHAGNKCADFLRNNLLSYITNNSYFPKDIPNAIKQGFKKVDEDYLNQHAFINNKLEDNSGSCGLILINS